MSIDPNAVAGELAAGFIRWSGRREWSLGLAPGPWGMGGRMAAYVVVTIEIRDPERYDEYKRLAPSSIAAYGGRYLVRGGALDVLEGGWRPERLVVLEFPTVEQARAWWASPEYAPGKALRQASARTDMVVVAGLAD